jgi:hypothetical protein
MYDYFATTPKTKPVHMTLADHEKVSPKDPMLVCDREGLIGKRIVAIRAMTTNEMEAEDWSREAVVIELDDGSTIYPSMDDEGNGPGALFGVDSKGQAVQHQVLDPKLQKSKFSSRGAD